MSAVAALFTLAYSPKAPQKWLEGAPYRRKYLKLLALPRGAREVSEFNGLGKGLGGEHAIEVHSVSVATPKPLASDLWVWQSGQRNATCSPRKPADAFLHGKNHPPRAHCGRARLRAATLGPTGSN